MSYKVVQEKDMYLISEKATELVVASLGSHTDARKICRSLNLGSGFNGLTPAFFCQGVRQAKKKGN